MTAQPARYPANDPELVEANALLGPKPHWKAAQSLARDLKQAKRVLADMRAGRVKPEMAVAAMRCTVALRKLCGRDSMTEIFEKMAREAEEFEAQFIPAPPVPEPKAGEIYVIEGGGFVKIGFSTNTPSRVASIQCSSPHQITILHVRPGTTDDERALHVRFAACRRLGEWFRREGDLAAWIEAGCP